MESQRVTVGEFFRALSIGPVERRLIALSFVVGIVVWPVIYALKEIVHWAFHEVVVWMEHAPLALFIFIPLLIGAAITAAIAWIKPYFVTYQAGDEEEELNAIAGDGVERTIALYRASESWLGQNAIGRQIPNPRLQFPTFGLAARKFFATLATLGGGASGGLEGSSALIGESLGAGVFGLYTRLRARRQSSNAKYDAELERSVHTRFLQTAQIAGVSAAVTVLIGAPLTSAFFATEVMYRDKPLFEKLFYGLIASIATYTITFLTFGKPELFHIEVVPEPATGWRYLLYLLLTAALVTIVGQLYRVLSRSIDKRFHQHLPNPYARHLTGAVVVGAIAIVTLFIMGQLGVTGHALEIVLGSGESAINAGLELANVNEATAWVAIVGLAASMLATLATIGSGGSAGLLVPSLFFGSMVAVIVSQWSGYLPLNLIPPAMTASLVAIAGTPITSLMFVIEIFGSNWILPSLVVLIIAYLMSNPNSVYRTRQDAPDEEELLPGMDVRRVNVPAEWSGKTVSELGLEESYDIEIIGRYRTDAEGKAAIERHIDATTTVNEGDVLAVTGASEVLDKLDTAIHTTE